MTDAAMELMDRLVKRAYEVQVRNEGDYIGDDGLLHCGKCWQAKETIIKKTFPDGTTRELKVPCECACVLADRLERERAYQDRKKQENIADLRRRSYMDTKYQKASFDSCDQGEQIAKCMRYAENFDTALQNNYGMLLYGDVGTGKSFAAACIANYLLEREIPVIMISFVKLFELMQVDPEAENNLINRMQRSRLVIFDDVGAERATRYSYEKVYNLVDTRYKAQKPMIVTTNLNPQDMREEEDINRKRIYDRIFDACGYMLRFDGLSYRMRNAAQRHKEIAKLLEG